MVGPNLNENPLKRSLVPLMLKPEAPRARPTNDISMEFEIRPNFAVLWFKIYSIDNKKNCTRHDNVTIVTCAQFRCDWLSIFLNQSTQNFGRISNSIEISLVGRTPGQN